MLVNAYFHPMTRYHNHDEEISIKTSFI